MKAIVNSFAAVMLAASVVNTLGIVRYVDVDSTNPTPPYTNWASAATVIQDAVDVAAPGDEILVTNGTYAVGGRAVHGTLTNRVAVYKPLTVRSINGPQFTVVQGHQVPGITNGDGAIRCVYLTNGASLCGFTLTKGATRNTGDEIWEESGGGLWCEWPSGTASNCVLKGNSAEYSGGGVYSGTLNNSSLSGNTAGAGGGAYGDSVRTTPCVLNNCTLSNNLADSGGGAYGSTLRNCTLAGNSARFGGGGAVGGTLLNCTLSGNQANDYNSYGGGAAGGAILTNCMLIGNTAVNGGGASHSILYNCTLSANSASRGGGVGDLSVDDSILHNCTLSANSARFGGGAAGGTLQNCVLFGNSATNYGGGASGSILNNCTVTGNSARESGGG